MKIMPPVRFSGKDSKSSCALLNTKPGERIYKLSFTPVDHGKQVILTGVEPRLITAQSGHKGLFIPQLLKPLFVEAARRFRPGSPPEDFMMDQHTGFSIDVLETTDLKGKDAASDFIGEVVLHDSQNEESVKISLNSLLPAHLGIYDDRVPCSTGGKSLFAFVGLENFESIFQNILTGTPYPPAK